MSGRLVPRYSRRVLVLAFDTSAPVVSVAVHDGTRVLAEATGEGAMAHGELLAPAIDRAVREAGVLMADITDVAVGVGPGPFTGLRVGVVTALTLGDSLGVSTHGVCSLDVLAAEVSGAAPFLVATDARRKEVYWGLYDGGARIEGPAVDRPDALAAIHSGIPVVGRGAELYRDVLNLRSGPTDPSAAVLAAGIAAGAFAELPLEPLYLRRPDVSEPTSLKRA
jgi:tRNA threonylcarbamoyladenosine biosynthesis protein TsaB